MQKLMAVILLMVSVLFVYSDAALFSQQEAKPDNKKIEGVWLGALNVSGSELRIVFKITVSASGSYSATMDSPDQGVTDIPVSNVTAFADSVRFDVALISGYYLGVKESASTITGSWHQSGMTFGLDLQKKEKAPELNRPQEPKPPYPYNEAEVEYRNEKAGIKLAGTLTTPKESGPFTAVILITGSGPQDRNESLLGHKPFLVLADYLTRQGFAVLRVDDRGVGGSEGKISESTSHDLAGDVLAGVEFLKKQPQIDRKKIGLIGHSEGGIIAPIVAAKNKDIAFIVLLAGTGLPGENILLLQSDLILRAKGVNEDLIKKNLQSQRQIYQIAKEIKDDSLALEKILALSKENIAALNDQERKSLGIVEENLELQLKQVISPWFRYFLTYDPRPTLSQVKCPVLAIIGEKDLQVPPKENLPAIENALKKGGNKNFVVKQLPGLNHLFQAAETGSPAEYAKIEETFSPAALKIVSDWIVEQTGK